MTRTPESLARAADCVAYKMRGMTYDEIGIIYRLSRERIRQIIKSEERRVIREQWLREHPPETPPPKPMRPWPLQEGSMVDARIWVLMQNMECRTVDELAAHSDRELLDWPNFGMKSLRRLREIAK